MQLLVVGARVGSSGECIFPTVWKLCNFKTKIHDLASKLSHFSKASKGQPLVWWGITSAVLISGYAEMQSVQFANRSWTAASGPVKGWDHLASRIVKVWVTRCQTPEDRPLQFNDIGRFWWLSSRGKLWEGFSQRGFQWLVIRRCQEQVSCRVCGR